MFGRICLLAMVLSCVTAPLSLAHDPESHGSYKVPTLNKPMTSVTFEPDAISITFGPIDLPAGHSGDLAASMPKHFFNLPEDRYMTGYKTEAFTKEGKALPREYLHHILLLDTDQDSISCPGEPLFFAGAGMEMRETRFPTGHGVKLDHTHKLMALVAFYHKAAPTKDAMARFTIYTAPKEKELHPMEVYQVGVNVVCFSKFDQRPANQSDEGIAIETGVHVIKEPLKFLVDGCVKFAYPHGHNGALLIALENRTRQKTLLRTVPDVTADGTLIGFPDRQVYSDPIGFPVSTKEEYEMVLVHHRPLEHQGDIRGMGNYLLYMTRDACPKTPATTTVASAKETQ
jgi:hypothetical protein